MLSCAFIDASTPAKRGRSNISRFSVMVARLTHNQKEPFDSASATIHMKYWIISDTHFNHTKLEEWGKRKGDWQDKLWNSLTSIPEEDILIHLGDICIGDDLEIHQTIIKSIRCKKILVRGNHDKKSVQWYQEHGWDFVVDSFELIFHGYYLFFSHRPTQQMGHYNYNLHGHTHGDMHHSEDYITWYDKDYNKDFSPELVGYSAINLETFIKKIKNH